MPPFERPPTKTQHLYILSLTAVSYLFFLFLGKVEHSRHKLQDLPLMPSRHIPIKVPGRKQKTGEIKKMSERCAERLALNVKWEYLPHTGKIECVIGFCVHQNEPNPNPIMGDTSIRLAFTLRGIPCCSPTWKLLPVVLFSSERTTTTTTTTAGLSTRRGRQHTPKVHNNNPPDDKIGNQLPVQHVVAFARQPRESLFQGSPVLEQVFFYPAATATNERLKAKPTKNKVM